VGLAGAGRPEQHDILGPLDKAKGGHLKNLSSRSAGRKAEIIIFKRLDRRETGCPGEHLTRAHPPGVAFGAQRFFQKISIGSIFALGRILCDRTVKAGERAEPKLLTQRIDALVLQIAIVSPEVV
jgi:hypothetical protein